MEIQIKWDKWDSGTNWGKSTLKKNIIEKGETNWEKVRQIKMNCQHKVNEKSETKFETVKQIQVDWHKKSRKLKQIVKLKKKLRRI